MSHEPPVPPGNTSPYPAKEPPHPSAPPKPPLAPEPDNGGWPVGAIVGVAAAFGAAAVGVAVWLLQRKAAPVKRRRKRKS